MTCMKCTWKTNKVNFLGAVIGPKGIEMEKENVKTLAHKNEYTFQS